jgi:RimJ/RimL family protein N-acetyltransferase
MVMLTTERLVLREFTLSDWSATNAYESDPEVVRYETFGPYSPEESRDYIRRMLRESRKSPREIYDLALVLRATDQLIGRCGLRISDPNAREGVLWYIVNRSYWGQGYATEAARAMLGYGFAELRLHRVWADADPANTASIRVLEKVGMRLEAHFRENAWIKGAWVDSLIFAILDREWAAVEAR